MGRIRYRALTIPAGNLDEVLQGYGEAPGSITSRIGSGNLDEVLQGYGEGLRVAIVNDGNGNRERGRGW